MIFAQPKFNQFCLALSCFVGLFVGMPTTICAHVYEDGFVERSLTITIRDGIGYGEYKIGLNAKTADQILELAEQLKSKDTPPNSRKELPNDTGQQDRLKLSQPALPTKPVDPNQAVDSGTAAVKAIESKTKAAEVPALAPEPDTVGSGKHLTDLQTIKRFGDFKQQWFTDHLKLSSDGQTVELSKVSVEPAARHPYSVVVKFQFSLHKKSENEASLVAGKPSVVPKPDSSGQAVDFQVTDGVFAEHAGATRYALRARGATMLLQSSVAPVLVRAERVEVDPKATVTKTSSPTVKAKLIVGSR